ncbi:hypothetical protein EVB81_176 [Rhizobium phage RHph_I46]|uniref:Uncharacterized protein n=1 Tax=Rhizobium phage RHph_I1_9 TaxID=2509729 RepID=A0A7S5R9Q9_9CAUD|nr:hypothetical protein PP936_gp175 [Rhizobium phage RHph_I1_9]QIG69745.1 hypothetical protein EVB81_176 [Rhizobium phage RHph_I46]QIG71026.1 hypothetical protein EVB92_176 [Rhizobium phage RHph_I9]QIG73612.1 hypothetical protein EVC04_175 [Rhizobium phage RHph_I1_9]QIG76365.1 hypothetical protein EVC25_176 [Rhizobium phage RHph_I34]
MGYTNKIRVDKEVTRELIEEYVDSLPEDETCPWYIEGDFPSAKVGDVINNSGSYGASGSLMRPFCHGLGKFLMERGYSCTVNIETLGYYEDETRYDAETQTITKIEESHIGNNGRMW